MNKINAVSAIVDTRAMTIYTNTGETVTILQGDARLAVFVKALQEGIKNPGDSVELDLDYNAPEPKETAPSKLGDFEKFEQQSGLVKFFKVAKKAVSKFFGQTEEQKEETEQDKVRNKQRAAPVEPLEVGRTFNLQEAVNKVETGKQSLDTSEVATAQLSSIEEVMAHAEAIPASSPDFRMTAAEEQTHDVVAVIQQDDGSLGMVPNAHKLATQVAHAAETGQTKGIEALLKRMAAISDTRQHSVEDLLKFIQRGDLPVTDDGRIVYYKLLNRTDNQFGYADIHTGNVPQGPGVRVQMDASLVDHNRRNECSNGLHVARRQYLGSFYGDSCILGSLNPEDVIAVPNYDANKMRVKGYDLHFLLSPEEFKMVKSNTPFPADSKAAKMLALIIAGKQPPVTHVVNIGGHRGTLINITKTEADAVAEAEVEAAVADAEPVAPIEEVVPHNDGPSNIAVVLDAAPLDPTQLAQIASRYREQEEAEEPESQQRDTFKAKSAPKTKAKAAPAAGSPRAKIAALLASEPMSAELAVKVNAIKRAAKKGWDKLGVDAVTEQKIKDLL